MDQVMVLRQDEPVRMDPDRLQALYEQLGDSGAEDVVCRAMEELALRLSLVERLYREGQGAEMRRAVRSLTGIADQIGMYGLCRAAGHVTACIDTGDEIALAATLSRLLRIGERSLTEIWDLQGFQV